MGGVKNKEQKKKAQHVYTLRTDLTSVSCELGLHHADE